MSTNKNLSFMDIITSTESCSLDMEYNREENEAVTLRQKVSNILQKKSDLKIRSNLTNDERRALKELQKDDKLRVHKFDKGCGFAIVTNDTVKEKIEEQLGKATKAEVDPTNRLTNKIQKKLCKLRKKNKFAIKTFLNYTHTTLSHHVYIAQLKRINRKNLSHASHWLYNRYVAS